MKSDDEMMLWLVHGLCFGTAIGLAVFGDGLPVPVQMGGILVALLLGYTLRFVPAWRLARRGR